MRRTSVGAIVVLVAIGLTGCTAPPTPVPSASPDPQPANLDGTWLYLGSDDKPTGQIGDAPVVIGRRTLASTIHCDGGRVDFTGGPGSIAFTPSISPAILCASLTHAAPGEFWTGITKVTTASVQRGILTLSGGGYRFRLRSVPQTLPESQLDGEWQVVGGSDDRGKFPPLEEPLNLTFANGQIAVDDGCNLGGGRYGTDANIASLQVSLRTQMACTTTLPGTASARAVAALNATNFIARDGNGLVFSGGSTSVHLAPTSVPPELDGAWTLLAASPGIGSRSLPLGLVLTFHGGLFFGTLGCNEFRGTVVTSGSEMRLKLGEATADECLGRMELSQGYEDALELVSHADVSGNTLRLTGSGIRLEFARKGSH